MNNNKSRGFTLVELLAVIAILAIIAVVIIPEVTKIVKKSEMETFKSSVRGLIRATNYEYKRLQMSGETESETLFIFENGVESSNVVGAKLEYQGSEIKNGVVKINQDAQVGLALYNDKWCAIKNFNSNDINLTEFTNKENCEIQKLVDVSGANAPKLVSGMTPIIWNGSSWIEASNTDDPYKQNWYDYNTKKWANAKTQDGSFWVWIPRYAYSISSGYHTSTAGTIEIKFLRDKSNTTSDGTTVASIPTYSGSSQTNFVLHPAFEFDGEITGFWMAKFEPSGTADDISILPNVASLRSMTIGAQFDAAYNMRNNNKYGWSASSVDTHMMKNNEWGAAVYLAQSKYGKNAEVWINPSSTYITGCAGTGVSVGSSSGCSYQYTTSNGQQASSTGNVYGIYDLSGGAYEYVAAYVDNGNSILTTNGESLLNTNIKYKNVYAKGAVDTKDSHYEANKNVIGDAIYETSSSYSGETSWYGAHSYMPYSTNPWFARGGRCTSTTLADLFYFSYDTGAAFATVSFRPVVLSL